MKTFEGFLDKFKKEHTINKAIIKEYEKYGFEISFDGKRNDNSYYFPHLRFDCETITNKYPDKGYVIEIRFLEGIDGDTDSDKEENAINYLKDNSLKDKNLYVWNYYKKVTDNYHEIVIGEDLANIIQQNIEEVYQNYKKNKKAKEFNL